MIQRLGLITVMALLCATDAAAQTTNCTTFGNQTSCQTQPGVGSRAPIDYWSQLNPKPSPSQPDPNDAGASFDRGVAEGRARRAAVDAAALRQRVGALVAAGDCDGATATALKAGDFDLAERAKGLCGPK